MAGAVTTMMFFLLPFAILLLFIAFILWIVFNSDRFKNPEEYKTKGSSGERIIYKTLMEKFHVPERQMLRNVYIPTTNGETTEIDLLVVSKKGLLVFEVKNYAGNIYGDARYKKWIQYLGKKKSYFYNPFMQNRTHVKHLRKFLSEYGNIPMIPMVTTISRGKWKIRNYGPEDYLLGYNSHLADLLLNTPDSELMAQHFNAILSKLTPLSRPDETVQEEHIERIKAH